MAEETRTFIFPENNGNSIDPNLWAALNNGGGLGGNMNSPFWIIVLLAFLRNNFGYTGDGGNCNSGFVASQIGQAVAGNANAISNLSTSLNCSFSQVQAGIAAIQNSIQQVANANNMSAMQIINSVNMGNSGIMNSLQTCCCDIKTAVTQGFGNLAYESAAQTCAIKQNDTDNTNRILAKIDAVQDEAKNNKIAELTAQLTAANSRAERAAELAPIYQKLNDIICKQPASVTIPYSPVTAVPNCVAWQVGLNGLGLNPYSQGGSIW